MEQQSQPRVHGDFTESDTFRYSYDGQRKACPNCGESVYVIKKASEPGFYSLSDARVLTYDGRVNPSNGRRSYGESRVLVPHKCSVAGVERVNKYRESFQNAISQLDAQISRLSSELSEIREQSEDTRDELNDLSLQKDDILKQLRFNRAELADARKEAALSRDCEKCGAEEGDPCEDLSKRKSGVLRYTKNPHDVRIPETLELEERGREVASLSIDYSELEKREEQLTSLLKELKTDSTSFRILENRVRRALGVD